MTTHKGGGLWLGYRLWGCQSWTTMEGQSDMRSVSLSVQGSGLVGLRMKGIPGLPSLGINPGKGSPSKLSKSPDTKHHFTESKRHD